MDSSVELRKYKFDKQRISEIANNHYVQGSWPVVYVISHEGKRLAYIGETADAIKRMDAHLKHHEKSILTEVHLITSDKFNKSATLDVEAKLIRYMFADGKYKLLNANLGQGEQNYYQKTEVYEPIFFNVWDKLRSEGLAEHSIEYIENTDLFKFSPYKTLSKDQLNSLVEILRSLVNKDTKAMLVEGGAGTGKSVLAIFLFKLLMTSSKDLNFEAFQDSTLEIRELVAEFKSNHLYLKMALVVPMTSFRKTLQKAFRNINGLASKMVIGPAEVSKNKYDVLLVDESHRLRRRKNLTSYSSFDQGAERLGLNKHTTNELDWVLLQAKNSVLFYDSHQSVRPTDIPKENYENLRRKSYAKTLKLVSQFRVRAGNDYVSFVNKLMNGNLNTSQIFKPKNYDLKLFDSLDQMVQAIKQKNETLGLCRLIAGFAWPWISKNDKSLFDIVEDGIELQWNSEPLDWINSTNALNEVGCIHTTQGYDLNISGIIIGKEIDYDPASNSIVISRENYHDKKGKAGVESDEVLKNYIVNVYETIFLRGIQGTYVYVCNKNMRDYLAQFIESESEIQPEEIPAIELIAYKNAVPLFDFKAAAGGFSETQSVEDFELVHAEGTLQEDMFACVVVGESMNKIIPNGSICLFRKDRGGSRNGKIVLVQHSEISDQDTGSSFTVKEYQSIKRETEEGWAHQEIVLSPRSNDASYKQIKLSGSQIVDLKVVGEFVKVIN